MGDCRMETPNKRCDMWKLDARSDEAVEVGLATLSMYAKHEWRWWPALSPLGLMLAILGGQRDY